MKQQSITSSIPTKGDIIVVVVVDPVPTSSSSPTPHSPTDLSLQTEPDMGAVYILLACLALSGIVVLGILVYCTSYCWRKRCFSGRRTAPGIKISTDRESRYTELQPNGLNGRPQVILTTADEQTSVLYARPRPTSSTTSTSLHSMKRYSTEVTARLSLDAGYGSANGQCSKNKGRRGGGNRKKDSLTEHNAATSPTAMFNGTVLTLSCKDGGKVMYCAESNGRIRSGSTGGDQLLADEIDRRSVLHYDVWYEKSHTSVIRGTLTFALRYDYIHRVLMVHLIRANHLTDKDHSAQCLDPYVKMYLLPERRYHCKSKIFRKTLDPEFNEMFSFDAPYSTLSSRMLQFTVYDFDRFTRHGLIGNVIVRDLFEKSDLHTWTEFSTHIIGDNEKDDYGDLLLYLSYDSNEGKLSICIAKACNLRPMDITGASDPYVKMIQLQGRRRVKTRRTTMKRANLHPVYNEILIFDLPETQIGNTQILIKVMDWDRIGRDDLLGSCVLGNESPTAEGREHWRQCFLRKQDKPIGMWHSLLAEVPEGFTNLTK